MLGKQIDPLPPSGRGGLLLAFPGHYPTTPHTKVVSGGNLEAKRGYGVSVTP